MNRPKFNILGNLKKAIAFLLIGSIAIGAFATLGDGKVKNTRSKNLLHSERVVTSGLFSLKSGYTYSGDQVLNNNKQYIRLNTVVTLQKGNITYTAPISKKLLLDNNSKVKFSIGNNDLKRN